VREKRRVLDFISIYIFAFLAVGDVRAFANVGASLPDFDMKRCVNMGNSFDAPAGQSWGAPLNISNFAKIKRAGFDTVRIPVRGSQVSAKSTSESWGEFIANYSDMPHASSGEFHGLRNIGAEPLRAVVLKYNQK